MMRDELSRCFVMLSFAAAFLLLSAQWRTASSSRPTATPIVTAAFQASLPPASALPSPPPAPPVTAAPRPALGRLVRSGLRFNRVRLTVDLSDREVYVYRGDQLQTSYPISVGKAGWETPTGEYRVLQLRQYPVWRHPLTKEVVPPGPKNPLGSRWIGFWTDGEYQIGFHGTNEPDKIGQAISHGCIRMYNDDIEALFTQVRIGAIVTVQP